jgi:hypothetical protein
MRKENAGLLDFSVAILADLAIGILRHGTMKWIGAEACFSSPYPAARVLRTSSVIKGAIKPSASGVFQGLESSPAASFVLITAHRG